MKSLLFFDTETTGLPLWDIPSEDPRQPRVTQIAAALVDVEDRKVIDTLTSIIKPEGWEIPQELQWLTGITMDRARDEGRPMLEVLPEFIAMWLKAEGRVSHGDKFDTRMIRIELMRFRGPPDEYTTAEFAEKWKTGASFCTMVNSQKILKLPATVAMHKAGRHGPKPPKLSEAYQFFTGKPLEGAHDAAVDVMACQAVYFGIKQHQIEHPKA